MNAAVGAPREGNGTSPRLATAEYGLRLAFFAAAPVALVLTSALVPMTGALINIVLTLAAFFFGEALRRRAVQGGWIARLLKRQLAFEAYYREHPPKPFVYYVFYPFLFPYWLLVAPARREFLLFKGYTILTLAILVLSGIYRYFFVYQPELALPAFAVSFAIGAAIESAAVITLLMPIVTTIVTLHQRAQRIRLLVLLAVALVSTAGAVGFLATRHRTFPSLETRQRVAQRTAARPALARDAMRDALAAAWRARRRGGWGLEQDGTLAGAPLENGRVALESFYRPDEAAAFDMWSSGQRDKNQLIVVYAEGPRRGRPVFLGMRSDGTLVARAAELPKPARRMMRTAGDL